jgi:hypothetical protein
MHYIDYSLCLACESDRNRQLQQQQIAEQMRRDAEHRAAMNHANLTNQPISPSQEMQMSAENKAFAYLHNQKVVIKKRLANARRFHFFLMLF